MKFFIDESLSPQLAIRLNDDNRHDALHPLHVGRRGEPDHRVLEWCLTEDRILVTQNARDFRKLIGKAELHPGLIILPGIDREGTWRLLMTAIAFLEKKSRPADAMVNHVLEIGVQGTITITPLPK